jgi:dimethylaniline monooxygenase (N-oxide forming)
MCIWNLKSSIKPSHYCRKRSDPASVCLARGHVVGGSKADRTLIGKNWLFQAPIVVPLFPPLCWMEATMKSYPHCCIIGAGSSGITTVKAFHDHGLSFDCFEASDRVGGNWVFQNKNGMSSAYRNLHINTSRDRMQYADFPMPSSYPDFPHHEQIATYFENYIDKFQLRKRITFNTKVVKAERNQNRWEVTLDSGITKKYDALVVANGHHWDPSFPDPPFPGSFDGQTLHAHHYIDNKIFENKRVVVLGMGNSAMDIAVESSYVAQSTWLAARRGAYVIPKLLFGKPLDQLFTNHRVPFLIRRKMGEAMYRMWVGQMEDYGLPKPDHGLGEAHPTISSTILDRLRHGRIKPKPNIERLEGKQIRFTDGSIENVDVLVYCTGYKVSFPFFDANFLAAKDNDLPLFRRVFHPDIDSLMFIGLLQPLGAIMPLAEAQSQWVTSYLRGEYQLPSRNLMIADMEQERKAMMKRYVRSKRHTMQVDFDDYLHALQVELQAGQQRAQPKGQKSWLKGWLST